MTKNDTKIGWWDHYCFDVQEVLRFDKKEKCHMCNKKYESEYELEYKKKIPIDIWSKLL